MTRWPAGSKDEKRVAGRRWAGVDSLTGRLVDSTPFSMGDSGVNWRPRATVMPVCRPPSVWRVRRVINYRPWHSRPADLTSGQPRRRQQSAGAAGGGVEERPVVTRKRPGGEARNGPGEGRRIREGSNLVRDENSASVFASFPSLLPRETGAERMDRCVVPLRSHAGCCLSRDADCTPHAQTGTNTA